MAPNERPLEGHIGESASVKVCSWIRLTNCWPNWKLQLITVSGHRWRTSSESEFQICAAIDECVSVSNARKLSPLSEWEIEKANKMEKNTTENLPWLPVLLWPHLLRMSLSGRTAAARTMEPDRGDHYEFVSSNYRTECRTHDERLKSGEEKENN